MLSLPAVTVSAHEPDLKGNRVKVPDSPAAVSSIAVRRKNATAQTAPKGLHGKARRTGVSQKTCRSDYAA